MGKWRRLLEVAFVAVVIVVAADLVQRWHTLPRGPLSVPAALPPAASEAAQPSPGAVIERTRVLLGSASPRPASASPAAPGTRSGSPSPGPSAAPGAVNPLEGLTLVGTLDAPSRAVALFTDARGRSVAYRRGQVVGGWRMVAMGNSCVKLQQGKEKWMVYPPSLVGSSASRSVATSAPPLPPPPPAPGVTQFPPRSAADSSYLVWSREEARAFLAGATPSGDMRTAPVLKDGAPTGCRADWIRPGSPLARLGVQAGDVLQSANGQVMRSADDVGSIYPILQRDGRLELVVDRQGRRAVLRVEVH